MKTNILTGEHAIPQQSSYIVERLRVTSMTKDELVQPIISAPRQSSLHLSEPYSDTFHAQVPY